MKDIPSLFETSRYARPGFDSQREHIEALKWIYYDTLDVSDGINCFFQNEKFDAVENEIITNMPCPGYLPKQLSFLVEGLSLYPFGDDDILGHAVMQFKIRDMIYSSLPAALGIRSKFMHEVDPSKAIFLIHPPILLVPEMRFALNVHIKSGTIKFLTLRKVRAELHGVLYRNQLLPA